MPVAPKNQTNRNRKRKIPVFALLIESSRASGRDLLCGIAKCEHHYGPWSLYWEPGGFETAWPKLKALDLDGIILRDVTRVDEVSALGVPSVVIGHSKAEIPNMVNVVTESASIGRIGAEHLLKCGFKHFAYCGYGAVSKGDSSQESFTWSDLREKNFSRFIHNAGFQVHAFTKVSPTAHARRAEQQRLAAWLQSLPKPIGLMACNDDCGRHVVEACKLANLSVPDTVSILGADNDEVVCGLSDPPLSSIAIHFERAGYEAALVLYRLFRGQRRVPTKIIVHSSHVVARRSTDITAALDPNVFKALQFIREEAQGNISVAEVSRAAGMSRRALEIKFRRELACSVRQYVQRIRVEQITRLLVETNLPVGRIADALGFSDAQHIARYFRNVKGMSPLAYRRAQAGDIG
jgi:LacI family transcriptional regulator